ncbi:MAG: putative transposase [Arenicella sp.]|jgi:REP element-mobilizing transposase RayT
MNLEPFYRGNLPHIQPLGGTFFVTYNLEGCIPNKVFKRWELEYEQRYREIIQQFPNPKKEIEKLYKLEFAKRDKYLDAQSHQDFCLKKNNVAQAVRDSLHFWDNKRLELYAYSIMPNHVHVVFRLFGDSEIKKPFYLQEITHSIKRHSAKECNKLLNLEGQFWQHESYDRLVRDSGELRRILIYILQNPVKAGLCKEMRDWKWSYLKEKYNDIW